MQNLPGIWRGILLMVAGMACFAIMNTGVRFVAETMPTPQMVFLRNVLSVGLILAWIMLRYDTGCFRTARLKSHFWRAGLGFIAMEVWFYSLSILPLALATALSFTTPVFGTLFAMWVLKEKAGWRRWAGIAVSFLGVLVILRPGMHTISGSASIVLVSSGLMALAGIVVKSLTRTEPPETIVFYMAVFMTPLSLPFAFLHWHAVSASEWAGLLVVALFSTAAHLFVARAYAYADMVALLPLDFLRLIFTAVLAWLVFGELVDGPTVAGALIILVSSVYIVHRESLRRAAGG